MKKIGEHPNALAEQAKELSDFQKYLHEEFKVGDRGLEKAQRIVAELSKVRCHAPFNEIPFDEDLNITYRKIRAIAEEGEVAK